VTLLVGAILPGMSAGDGAAAGAAVGTVELTFPLH